MPWFCAVVSNRIVFTCDQGLVNLSAFGNDIYLWKCKKSFIICNGFSSNNSQVSQVNGENCSFMYLDYDSVQKMLKWPWNCNQGLKLLLPLDFSLHIEELLIETFSTIMHCFFGYSTVSGQTAHHE